jgi:hypothetical protein
VRALGFRKISGFISFAADWKPHLLALKAPYLRSGSFKRLAKYALRPVFQSFGLEWRPPPISVLSPGAFVQLVGIALAFGLMVLLTVLGILH